MHIIEIIKNNQKLLISGGGGRVRPEYMHKLLLYIF